MNWNGTLAWVRRHPIVLVPIAIIVLGLAAPIVGLFMTFLVDRLVAYVLAPFLTLFGLVGLCTWVILKATGYGKFWGKKSKKKED